MESNLNRREDKCPFQYGISLKKKKKSHNDRVPQVTFAFKLQGSERAGGRLAVNDSFCGAETSMPQAGSGTAQPQPSPVCIKPTGLDYHRMIDVLGWKKLAQGRVQ